MPFSRGSIAKPLSRLFKTGVLSGAEIAAARALENAVLAIQAAPARRAAPPLAFAPGRRERRLVCEIDDRRFFERWLAAMTAAGFPAGPVLDAVVEGRALAAIDRAARKRKGWARGCLRRGLQVAAALRAAGPGRKIA